MSRYIDADKLLKGYEDHELISTHLIWNAPTADVVEVRHGHWIDYDDDIVSCECSACHKKFNLYEDDVNGYSYCPNCGAKMDREEQEHDIKASTKEKPL